MASTRPARQGWLPVARVLVTEEIADGGLQLFRDKGHGVDVRLGLSPSALLDMHPRAHALIIRSTTKVTADVLQAGADLVVVGRAGIGLDNVDVEAATRQGVMVVNTPQSNVLSTAEHALTLMLAQLRNIPQAHAALQEGRWSAHAGRASSSTTRSSGSSASVGCANSSRNVPSRSDAAARLRPVRVARPWTADERGPRAATAKLVAESTSSPSTSRTARRSACSTRRCSGSRTRRPHRQRQPQRHHRQGRPRVGRPRGHRRGRALDVFAEDRRESPLCELDSVIVTPHLGASTRPAQTRPRHDRRPGDARARR